MSRARKIEVGDITPAEAGRQMGLTLAQFEHCLPGLLDRGFPPPDPTTGNYDLDAISVWRRSRNPKLFPGSPSLTIVPKLRDAREKLGSNGHR
jgi:hypothetical protein